MQAVHFLNVLILDELFLSQDVHLPHLGRIGIILGLLPSDLWGVHPKRLGKPR